MAELHEDIETIRADIRKLANDFMMVSESRRGEVSEELIQEWRNSLQGIGANAEALSEKLRANTSEVAETIDQAIKQHPLCALAIAASVGLVFDTLWRR